MVLPVYSTQISLTLEAQVPVMVEVSPKLLYRHGNHEESFSKKETTFFLVLGTHELIPVKTFPL